MRADAPSTPVIPSMSGNPLETMRYGKFRARRKAKCRLPAPRGDPGAGPAEPRSAQKKGVDSTSTSIGAP